MRVNPQSAGRAAPAARAARAVTAFAPATVANVAVGFDLLGFALAGIGDRVTVVERLAPDVDSPPLTVEAVGSLASEIPLDPALNTATVALQRLLALREEAGPFHVRIEKGIPVGSGLGSSAASAVAAVVAANALLVEPLSRLELLECAIAGEAVASGTPHADNVAASLYGGLQLVLSCGPPEVVALRVPPGIHVVVVYPRLRIETRQAREILRGQVDLSDHVRQSALLAGFIVGSLEGDLNLIRRTMRDVLIEPQRARLVPGFDRARRAALGEGALSFSLSGSGPSVFGWAVSSEAARRIGVAVELVFSEQGLESEIWTSPLGEDGARVVEVVPA
jgi:homoserine kinase